MSVPLKCNMESAFAGVQALVAGQFSSRQKGSRLEFYSNDLWVILTIVGQRVIESHVSAHT
jgi:hypothetical protein